MSIGRTNSLYNNYKDTAYEIKHRVNDVLAKKARGKKKMRLNALKFFRVKPATCSQCKRGMDRKTANLQIENKRENAPICIPCILGIPRRPLEDVIKKRK